MVCLAGCSGVASDPGNGDSGGASTSSGGAQSLGAAGMLPANSNSTAGFSGALGSAGAHATGGASAGGAGAAGGAEIGGVGAAGGAEIGGASAMGGTSGAATAGAVEPGGGRGGAAGSVGTGGSSQAATCNETGSVTAQTPTIWVIGDSTASVYGSSAFPRMGWAQPMKGYYTPACASVQDKALSGRSSKSFYEEGAWTPIRNALKPGDFVLIQFGHNDEKDDDATLYTVPGTTYKEYLSKYIDQSQAKGATPILLTSIARNKWQNGKLVDTHGAYPGAMRELAAARTISLVDATALTTAFLGRLGEVEASKLFLNLAKGQFPNYPDGNTDNTHLQEVGANKLLRVLLADMHRQALPPGLLTKEVPQAP